MIKNGRLNNEVIYETLNILDLDIEIEEDLFFKVEAFLNLYSVFNKDYTYLED